jgi:hypothetical protein
MTVYSDGYIYTLQLAIILVLETMGVFRQFLSIQLDNQLNRQTLKFRTAAFPTQQFFLYSSFLSTTSHRQPKQTDPKYHQKSRTTYQARTSHLSMASTVNSLISHRFRRKSIVVSNSCHISEKYTKQA